MSRPRVVITGASGFIGRHLLEGLKARYDIIGLARRSQMQCGAATDPSISWYQVDIGEREHLAAAFKAIREDGPVDFVIHLAAHYDFTGEKHPEYWRTNVEGLRNVLEECRSLDLQRFVFASSLAACAFPKNGDHLDESSPPDGEHIYAITKRQGEEMLAEYDDVPSSIVRFAALFSDWCEYPPVYFFLETWMSKAWNQRILGGRGESAIPYMHVREIVPFFCRLLEHSPELGQREVLICSGNSTTDHRDLFELTSIHAFNHRRRPIFVPAALATIGVIGRDLLGRLLGNRPFERPWMMRYVDQVLAVDASATHRRLRWKPRERLQIERRMPFMVEHKKANPAEWHRRNRSALKAVRLRPNLRIHHLLEKHQETISEQFLADITRNGAEARFPTYQTVPTDVLSWRFTLLVRQLQSAIRTGDRGPFQIYCRDLAEKRISQGFRAAEVCGALELCTSICIDTLNRDPESRDLDGHLRDQIAMTFQFGCDQVLEVFEESSGYRYTCEEEELVEEIVDELAVRN